LETKTYSQKRIYKILKFLSTGIIVGAVSYYFLFTQLFYCQAVRFAGFQSAGQRVFVSPQLNPSGFPLIKKLIKEAEIRVDSFYDGKESSPTYIICSTPIEYQKYCSAAEGAGCSLGTPWGETFVVLNPDGFNTDVISHELSHAELLSRLGWWNVTFKVPQWFNEGIALMMDRRFVDSTNPVERYMHYNNEWLYHTGGGQIILELDEITTIKSFFNGSSKRVMLAYMTAAAEVSYWLASMNEDGFSEFLRLMSSGQSFKSAYHSVENQTKPEKKYILPHNPLRLAPSDE
jgi:hypothetical protein